MYIGMKGSSITAYVKVENFEQTINRATWDFSEDERIMGMNNLKGFSRLLYTK